ncbi:hypothetical protein TwortDSMZ_132 [Staphylococcus phage Twort]|uniref:ORF109 n=2 Tax=Staphylococcus phage Twort (strain DSM 17442 / HER 48) TaxID=2908167 RepID=Q4Z9B7_BPTWO|nr:hypothetical protein TwortORF109 [Staphylococcus phage Twort]AAX92401.1 ORF109 [Staphylococcus phage Twort]QIW89131.1 hypothetical protein TwortDSMZ_132 [Staphylococcus phage Twort]
MVSYNNEDFNTVELTDILDKDQLIEFLVKNQKVNNLDISKVKQDKFDMNMAVLQFQDDENNLTNICNVENLDEGLDKIRQIFKDSELEHRLHYFRVVEHEDYYWIDYGSHHTFFRVTKRG